MTTQRAPDGLSSIFAENRGADSVTLWNGALALGGDPPLPGETAGFFATIPVTTPFYYNPAMGNLLLEVAGVDGQAFLPGALDAHNAIGDSVSLVIANSNLSPSGSARTLGLVTRFDITIVPEPSTWLLATAAAAVLSAVRFLRRSQPLPTCPKNRSV